MERYVVLAQKDILFHGTWKAESKVSDSLVRKIAAGLASTRARLCKLVLTSAGLRLIMLDGRREQTEPVSFDSLRDIIPNHYYQKCLLVIYVDASENLSVMACSCDNARDVDIISKTFRNHKQQLQRFRIRSEPQQTTTIQEKPRFLSEGHHPVIRETFLQTRLPNSHAYETLTATAVPRGRDGYGSSQTSELSCRSLSSTSDIVEIEDVFADSRPAVGSPEPEVFIREPMIWAGKRVAFNLGVQTQPTDEDADTNSINSASSTRALKDDMKTLTNGVHTVNIASDSSSGISKEQFYRRTENGSNKNTVTFKDAVGNTGSSSDNFSEGNDRHMVQATAESYDLRSVSIQTMPINRSSRRYFKKTVTAATTNANKEKIEALRKRSSSAGPKNPSSSSAGPKNPSSSSGGPKRPSSSSPATEISSFVLGSSTKSFNSSWMGQTQIPSAQTTSFQATTKNPLASGVTTVVKPIEDVYQSRTVGRPDKSRGQRVIVFTSTGQSRM